MDKLLDYLYTVKDKITDFEYMELMDAASTIHRTHKAASEIDYVPGEYVFGTVTEGDSLFGFRFEKECFELFWEKDLELHRTEGPARISIKRNNEVEEWRMEGVIHRDDGPAVIKRVKGRQIYSAWYHLGKLHRTDGPAIIINHSSGYVEEMFFIHGRQKVNARLRSQTAESEV